MAGEQIRGMVGEVVGRSVVARIRQGALMPHDTSLISMLAVGFGLSMVLGYLAHQLKIPAIVGYLLAGVLLGPHTPGFQADVGLAGQLAEVGVMLLMFGVGLHFSLDELLSVKKIALPGALIQIAVATAMGTLLGWAWGWGWFGAVVFGLCLSVASTIVLLRALEKLQLLDSVLGKIAVGWLIVEDLVMILVLVLMPVFHGLAANQSEQLAMGEVFSVIGFTLLKVSGFVALMLVVGKRVLPKILWMVSQTGSRELFTLAVISLSVSVAFASAKLFDVSFALGAFFAGMMLSKSEFSRRAANQSLPLRDAFAVLFFVSVGMLFDPHVLADQPFKLMLVLLIILLGKTLAAIGLVLLFLSSQTKCNKLMVRLPLFFSYQTPLEAFDRRAVFLADCSTAPPRILHPLPSPLSNSSSSESIAAVAHSCSHSSLAPMNDRALQNTPHSPMPSRFAHDLQTPSHCQR
jgi:CPA2 family monovalent cation:H+ antiporter-2